MFFKTELRDLGTWRLSFMACFGIAKVVVRQKLTLFLYY